MAKHRTHSTEFIEPAHVREVANAISSLGFCDPVLIDEQNGVLDGIVRKEPLRATSLFFAIAAVPWYFKIVVGLLSDSIPLFGTRWRHYLLVSATLAGALWLQFLSPFALSRPI